MLQMSESRKRMTCRPPKSDQAAWARFCARGRAVAESLFSDPTQLRWRAQNARGVRAEKVWATTLPVARLSRRSHPAHADGSAWRACRESVVRERRVERDGGGDDPGRHREAMTRRARERKGGRRAYVEDARAKHARGGPLRVRSVTPDPL